MNNKIIKNDPLIKKIIENRKNIKPKLYKIKKYKHILFYNDMINSLHLKEYIYSGYSVKINNNIFISKQNNLNDIFRLFIEKVITNSYNSICYTEKEEIKLVLEEKILKEFYHTYNCNDPYCNESYCIKAENLIYHIFSCKDDKCNYNDCISSKRLLLQHVIINSGGNIYYVLLIILIIFFII
jgi:hypothetical protein